MDMKCIASDDPRLKEIKRRTVRRRTVVENAD
jgi:hypothetical protein